MAGIIALLAAIVTGALVPVPRWRALTFLAFTALLAGALATREAAASARDAGLHFVITPNSILRGVALQAVLMLALFVAGASVARLVRRWRAPTQG